MASLAVRCPLPPINNEQYESQVFTHKSVAGLPASQVYEDEVGHDNERFALLGDSVINLIVLDVLEDEFPLSRRGDLDRKRSLLVCRERVEQWSEDYGLSERLQVHYSQKQVIPKNPAARIQVFQAYVGALFKESGYEVVRGWFEFVVEEGIRDIQNADPGGVEDILADMNLGGSSPPSNNSPSPQSTQTPGPPPASPPPASRRKSTGSSQTAMPGRTAMPSNKLSTSSNKSPLALLNEITSQKNIKLNWSETKDGEPHEPIFTITVTLVGSREVLGQGVAGAKAAAKQQAATEALKALKLT